MNDFVADILNFEEYLKEKDLQGSTIRGYSSIVKKFLKDCNKIDSIEEYNKFIFEHGIKKRSNYVYDAIKAFIKFKFDKDPRKANLLMSLIKSKIRDPKKVIHHIPDSDRDEIISLMKLYKHRLMAKMQNTLGVRAGDVLRLKRGSVNYEAYDDKNIVMRIDFEGKGRKHLIKWVFDQDLQTQIDLFIKSNLLDDDYYFLERKPNESITTSLQNQYNLYLLDLKQALKLYGVEFKGWATHDFRRSFARNVWNKTKDPVVLKEMLDHTQFDTTLRYLRGTGMQSKDVYFDLNKDKLARDT